MGTRCYRDGSRSGILVKETKEEIFTPTLIQRPVELDCIVDTFKNEKKDWVAFIGTIDGTPYEIFTGPKDLDLFPIPSYIKIGKIIKNKDANGTSRYDFQYTDNCGYVNTLGGLSRIFDKEYWNYARLVSALLRNNTPIEQVVKIVDGMNFDSKSLNNWKAGVIRTFKSFITDGVKSVGEKCSECGQEEIVYEGGCKICKNCGNSQCG